MRRLLGLILLLQTLHVGVAQAAKRPLLQLVVTAPYLEMHSGPGRGYPVIYVVGRDELVTVLYSRTDWYKVRAPHGPEGWARRADLAITKLAAGEPAPIPPYPDFASHRWEVGAGYGVYNRQNLVTGYVDYSITESIDAEAVLQQALGTLDNRVVASIGLRHTFIPEWRWLSPTGGLGTAISTSWIRCRPRRSRAAMKWPTFRFGARGFITRRFMWRADWRHYVVFNNLNVYEELEEWKVGFAVFF